MIWLALSIVCSTSIFILFKIFPKYGIDNLQAIVFNYFAAFGVGILAHGDSINVNEINEQPWFVSMFILGFLFISLFQLMAYVAQKFGMTAVSIAVKMSFVVPVLFAISYYKEGYTGLKIVGIVSALAAVYLATRKPGTTKGHPALAILPVVLFLGSGFLDSLLKVVQQELVPDHEHALFTSLSFFTAGLIGVLWYGSSQLFERNSLQLKNVIAGIALGIPNYGSIYFLIKALDIHMIESSLIFPVNNVGIVALSVVCARVLFTEKMSKMNKLGVILAMLSIAIMIIENYTR